MTSKVLAEFKNLITDLLQGYLSTQQVPDPSRFCPSRAVKEMEARLFLRAVQLGIVKVDYTGRCTIPGLRKTGEFCLFWPGTKGDPGCHVFLWWEWLTQAGIVAELVNDFGYPKEQISLDLGPFDAIIHHDVVEARPLIAVEVKDSKDKVSRMLSEMESPLSATQNTLRKVLGLFEMKPRFFWVVSPDNRQAYRVEESKNSLYLQPISDIPHYERPFRTKKIAGDRIRVPQPKPNQPKKQNRVPMSLRNWDLEVGTIARLTVFGYKYQWAIISTDSHLAELRMAWRERRPNDKRWIGPIYEKQSRMVPKSEIVFHDVLMSCLPPERSLLDLEWKADSEELTET